MRSVRLDPELDAWLQRTAEATGRPVSDVIQEAILAWRYQREGERRGLAAGVAGAASGDFDPAAPAIEDVLRMCCRRSLLKPLRPNGTRFRGTCRRIWIATCTARRDDEADSFLQALARYESRGDKTYSLTDCSSMNIMAASGIQDVLMHDAHFRQEGFNCLIGRS